VRIRLGVLLANSLLPGTLLDRGSRWDGVGRRCRPARVGADFVGNYGGLTTT
jgi:hypothetical protein